jgi:hypothetical protein
MKKEMFINVTGFCFSWHRLLSSILPVEELLTCTSRFHGIR